MNRYERIALTLVMLALLLSLGLQLQRYHHEAEREQSITRCADAYIATWPEGLSTVRHTSVCENLTEDDLAVAYMRAATLADGG